MAITLTTAQKSSITTAQASLLTAENAMLDAFNTAQAAALAERNGGTPESRALAFAMAAGILKMRADLLAGHSTLTDKMMLALSAADFATVIGPLGGGAR